MQIEISHEERKLLAHLIEHEIQDLGPEIRHTQTSSYRDGLKADREALKSLLKRLAE
jgi:hypothetical protein